MSRGGFANEPVALMLVVADRGVLLDCLDDLLLLSATFASSELTDFVVAAAATRGLEDAGTFCPEMPASDDVCRDLTPATRPRTAAALEFVIPMPPSELLNGGVSFIFAWTLSIALDCCWTLGLSGAVSRRSSAFADRPSSSSGREFMSRLLEPAPSTLYSNTRLLVP